MNLNRKQVRLLITSIGDHERLPKSGNDKDIGDEIDLTRKGSPIKKLNVPAKYLKMLRKGIKHTKKFNMFNEKADKNMRVIKPSGVVKNGKMNISSARDLLDIARKTKGIKFGHRGKK